MDDAAIVQAFYSRSAPEVVSWGSDTDGHEPCEGFAGPSTQYLRTLGPKTMLLMVFGTRVLKYWVLGPSGEG